MLRIEDTLLAMEISAYGGPEVLKPCSRAMPKPGYGQILIRIAYAGVNRPDALQRAGLYAPPKGACDLPGLECSGIVVGLGEGVSRWALGDQVCALLPGGGYSTYAICHASHALPIPKDLSLREAACLPETCFTVWSNMVMRGGLRGGEKLLIHGGTSGIGTTAIQIAKSLGARVFTTAGSAQKTYFCKALGAEAAWNYQVEDFSALMRAEGGADVIIDMIGGPYIQKNIKALADDGRLVQIAYLQGAKQEVNFTEMMTRRLTLTGSTLRPQTDLQKARIAAEVETHVWPLIAAQTFKPIIDSEFPLQEAAKAHAYMESSNHIGKIVLAVTPEDAL